MLVGAKFWQDNWERHIDLLEDFVTGPIYKTYLAQSGQLEGRNLNVVSVTKANQIVSELFVVFWGALCTILLLYQPLVSSFIDLNYHYILYMSLIFLYIFASAAIKMWLDRKLTSSVTAKVGDVFDNVTHNMATRGALTDADPNWQKQEK
ncbi:MAG: hypothetical protein A3D16_10065 [Rhodobacterales bacterium RIFCSPHIGHO2_02_FULL_62_130]|nr:MAG: hypothetical protein A3D16_10065 [Rhodobacterales bacterium RIFCSPHIGHO2_02_FULL_62_130]OHC56354.1 MAG: hypothetical protein A3E48_20990 [Rhodobacterales bacterium RIFCSPHIGHO2_12_FULL_62_75]